MNDLAGQFVCCDIGIREALTLFGDFAYVDGLFRAVLYAAQTADAVGAEFGFSVFKQDVIPGADPLAGTAADARVIGCEFL